MPDNPNSPQRYNPDIESLSMRFGLHPLVAGGMCALDHMLFVTLEVPSMGLLAVVSFFVGLAAIVPCVLIQKYSFADNWGAALGKGALVGLLTAVPSPLPGFLTLAWGVMGAVGLYQRSRLRNAPPADPPADPDTIDMPN